MNRKRTRRGLVALAGAAALIGGGISAGPAAAITDCRPYASEAEVLAETRPECRDTDIVSPALGSLLTRAQVEAASQPALRAIRIHSAVDLVGSRDQNLDRRQVLVLLREHPGPRRLERSRRAVR